MRSSSSCNAVKINEFQDIFKLFLNLFFCRLEKFLVCFDQRKIYFEATVTGESCM